MPGAAIGVLFDASIFSTAANLGSFILTEFEEERLANPATVEAGPALRALAPEDASRIGFDRIWADYAVPSGPEAPRIAS